MHDSDVIHTLVNAAALWVRHSFRTRERAVEVTLGRSNTFTRVALDEAIDLAMAKITVVGMASWIGRGRTSEPKTVAVLNAGNVPFVGLQDLLAVLATGHRYVGVLSSKSPDLLPAFVSTAAEIGPGIEASFSDLETALHQSDALIATGASATVSQVAAVAGRCGIRNERCLLRGTRFSVAVVDGRETNQELEGLARDCLLHDGRGCLNVSIVLAPDEYDPSELFQALGRFRERFPAHPATLAAIDLERRLFKATGRQFSLGDGFLLLEGPPEPRRPGAVVVSRYKDIADVARWLNDNAARLQTVVVDEAVLNVPTGVAQCRFGEAQDPPLAWKPDGKDTIAFLGRIRS